MKPLTAFIPALIAATGFALAMQSSCAKAQSLFNNRASSGQGQTTTTTGSLFSRNTGFAPAANATGAQGAASAFVGRSNRGFVGSRTASQSSASGADVGDASRRATAPRRAGSAVTERAETTPAASQQREAAGTRGRRRPIVPRHRIAFGFAPKQATAISSQLTTQLAKLSETNSDFANIQVQVEPGGRVKLQGQVPSNNTRKLVAILVRLEPGVRQVENELSVAAERK